jgi:tetratricopeptide (TPR) repeat protein
MLRQIVAVALLFIGLTGWTQSSPSSSTPQEGSSKQQQVDITTPPTTQPPPEQQPEQPTKERSKVSRKVDQALPDCVNLIFYHGCRHSTARQEDADEKQQQKLVEAANRCKQLTAALPTSLAAKASVRAVSENPANSGENSSKQPHETAPYCTAEDVVAADHDVDVGDFNFENKNYRGAEMRYRSALERLPGEPVATLHLARALEKLGNKTQAYDQYKIFLEWSPTGKDAQEANAALVRLKKELALK